jgi:hypothetical protein
VKKRRRFLLQCLRNAHLVERGLRSEQLVIVGVEAYGLEPLRERPRYPAERQRLFVDQTVTENGLSHDGRPVYGRP